MPGVPSNLEGGRLLRAQNMHHTGMAARNIVAIGASAGGIEAIRQLAAELPPDLDAAVLATLHIVSGSDEILPALLNRSGPLPASNAVDGEPVHPGRIYVAPPDYHLILKDQRLQLSHGPKENFQRPCINAMFRSVAEAFGPRASGILLTGTLDDGAAGLWAIQQRGGSTIVQDPEEALFRAMPENAIRGLNVQYIVRIREMGPLLTQLTRRNERAFPAPAVEPPLEPGLQTCPECGGAMSTIRLGGLREYRCHIGHRFGLRTLIAEKRNVVENFLDSALAQSEELTDLLAMGLSDADPAVKRILHDEIAERRREQQALRELASRPMADLPEPGTSSGQDQEKVDQGELSER
jgi:two-component system chemotaxis response regulator CheB